MWGALAMSCPSRSNTAQLKSRRSLMFTEWAVLASVAPICSAMDMNRLLKISSITGSASVPMATVFVRSTTRVRTRCPRPVSSARQPGSTTVVAVASVITAGPSMAVPGTSASRS